MSANDFWPSFNEDTELPGGDSSGSDSPLASTILNFFGINCGSSAGSALSGLDIKHMDAEQLINLSLLAGAADSGIIKEMSVDEYGIVQFVDIGSGDGLSGCEVYYQIQSYTYSEECTGVMVTGRKPHPRRKAADFKPIWQSGTKEIYNASWLSQNGMSAECANYATIVFDDPQLISTYVDGIDNLYDVLTHWESIIGYARYINWPGSENSAETTVERANTSVVPIKVCGEGDSYDAPLGVLYNEEEGTSLSAYRDTYGGAGGIEIPIPAEFRYTTTRGVTLDKLINIHSVVIVGRKVNTLIGVPISTTVATDPSAGNTKVMCNIDSNCDSMYTLKRGDHYIIDFSAENPRIVFSNNSRANDPANFGSGIDITVGDDSAFSPGGLLSSVSVLPTGGTDGYLVKQVVALLNIKTPCINIYDPTPNKALEIANTLEYELAALILIDEPAPVATGAGLIDQTAGVIDHDPTTIQNLSETPYEAAVKAMEGGGVSVTIPSLTEAECCSMANVLKAHLNGGNGSIITYVCGPNSSPSIGGYGGDSASVINDIVYSYSDSNSYTVSVTTGPRLLGNLSNVVVGATSMKTENVPSVGTVIQDCGNHVHYKVRLDQCGIAPVVAINTVPSVIRVGDVVQCTLYNNAVEQ